MFTRALAHYADGIRWFLLSVLIGVALSSARAEAKPPLLEMQPAALDLGTAQQGQVLKGSVKITNRGSEPLMILSADASCDCTSVTPGKTVLATGESTTLAIKSETRTYQGLIRRMIIVRTSANDFAIPLTVFVQPPGDDSDAKPQTK